jgi:hypothetical protein
LYWFSLTRRFVHL